MTAPIPLDKLFASAGVAATDWIGNPRTVVTGLQTHAQRVARNDLFVALNGVSTDSHMLVGEAVRRGAAAVLVEREAEPIPGVCVVRTPDTRRALGALAQAFHGFPARAMAVCGVTGTNGKTTVTHLLRTILAGAGRRVGLVGTLGAHWEGGSRDLGMTTPGPLALAEVLAAMERARVDSVVMEVSSHAIDQKRIASIPMHIGVLTNVSQDHLDYHGDFESYREVKKRLFKDFVARTPGSVSCFNADDPTGAEMAAEHDGARMAFSADADADCLVRARNVAWRPDGTDFDLAIGRAAVRVRGGIIGPFNLSNMLAAACAAHALGLDLGQIADGLEAFEGAPGRFERIDAGQPFLAIVDYAHTPDALEKVLRAARRLTLGRLICVFGAGGNRDRGKRPLMGRVAGELSDLVVVTSDNPRNEDPEDIARHIEEGLRLSGLRPACSQRVLDRRQAIERAVNLASPGDCIVVAGKGHEATQEVEGVFHPFDDREALRAALSALANGAGLAMAEAPEGAARPCA